MSEIKIFENKEFGKVRTTLYESEPYFCLKDICDILEISQPSKVKDRLNPKGVNSIPTLTNGGTQEILYINEPNFYKAVFQSRKPQAEMFSDWVTSEVLPTIRKTGGYVSNDDMFIESYLPFADDTTKALFKSTLETVRKQNELIGEQKKQIEVMKPKEEFFDAVTDSKTAIAMSDVAKVLDMGIGRNKLFEILRNKKILMQNNHPYQTYIDRGYFRVIETRYDKPNGDTAINIKTLVYQKGIDFIRKILEEN